MSGTSRILLTGATTPIGVALLRSLLADPTIEHALAVGRTATLGSDFRYELNSWRFHFSGVLDGRRAAAALDYRPAVGLVWPPVGV